jgi:hypothetical protein
MEFYRDRGLVTTDELPATSGTPPNDDALHQPKMLVQPEQRFTDAVLSTTTTEESIAPTFESIALTFASISLTFEHGIAVALEAIWHQLGNPAMR